MDSKHASVGISANESSDAEKENQSAGGESDLPQIARFFEFDSKNEGAYTVGANADDSRGDSVWLPVLIIARHFKIHRRVF
jgi:hypothetical protein